MKEIPHKTLTECLDLLEQGLGVEEILARFPDQEEALRPFLNTAARLSRVAYSPSLAARHHSRQAALREVDALQAQRTPVTPIWLWLQQAFRPALSLALLLLLFAVALPLLAAPALPGDSLYGAKRFVEEARLSLAAAPDRRASLLAEFNAERIREVQALLDDGRSAEVQFRGDIMQIEPDYWTVASLRAYLSPDTTVEGQPWLGGSALIQGRTEDGRLLASRLVVLEQPPPPAPLPTPTPLPPATGTPTPTVTASPSPTASPTLTDTPQLLPSSTPSPPVTSTLPPAPTVDDDNANDNGDDDNDNDDDDVNDNGDDNVNDNDDGDDNDNGDDDNTNDNGDDETNENDDDDNDNDNDDDGTSDDDEEERDDDNSDDDS